ncbi:interferon gamma-like [Pristis pectinata]|uniref:interferon gamma-like n=1 Tax=Pristis pectinata TaxID=685728 RepID=UPI00223D1AC7|nr:interferon gamma-like [Pristis pectinata]
MSPPVVLADDFNCIVDAAGQSSSANRRLDSCSRLLMEVNINHPEVADGGAKFITIFRKYNSKATESGIMLSAIVRWYLDLFENMKPHQNSVTKEAINVVANGLQEWLRSDKYFSLLNDLKELENIKWDDQLIQRKAILELETFLSKMKEIGKKRRKRNMLRKRRP